ncbi:MAG: nuclear transport factor 2 family protein [Rhodospirillales bacterium]|nr:nuclear transport factor 2 family protein [Rhodospirillales bacterium]QQS10784.1 MAG: nuclear transport factor 2 family protein [Rhodospirillales bacterium]
MTPTAAERDAIFKAFGRAFFRQDLDAMYEVVAPDFVWTVPAGDAVRTLDSRDKIAAFFEERRETVSDMRFGDVVFHHAPEATFMTYRMSGTDKATGKAFAFVGVERYTFRDGRLTAKDVYSRPAPVAA